MGAYLSQPKTTKESTDCESVHVRYGASSMQGWRISQEDAHNCILDFDENTSLFAVYDGHGGHEVAEYCSKKLPDFLKETENYKQKNYEEALKDAFLQFDGTLATPDVIAVLKAIAKGKKEDSISDQEGRSDSEEEEAIDNLMQEAHMPLDEVMAKYKGVKPQLRLLKGEGNKPPLSPMLRARRTGAAGCSSAGAGCSTSSASSSGDGDGPSSSSASSGANGGDGEVSSSSSGHAVTGLCNGDIHINGEIAEGAGDGKNGTEAEVESSDPKKEKDVKIESDKSDKLKKCEEKIGRTEPDSSGISNGESHDVSSSSEDGGGGGSGTAEGSDGITSSSLSKKKMISAVEIYKKLLQEDSDSEEEDETFTADAEDSDDASTEDGGEGAEEKADDEEDSSIEEDDDEEDEEEEDNVDFTHEEPGSDSGCTAVMALLVGSNLYVANAGDSRCVVCRDGKAVDMSFDHKPEDKLENERIKAAGGSVTCDGRVNGGLNLSRAIGDHAYKQTKGLPPSQQMITALPDIQRLTVDPIHDRFMVLACDGIWNSMTSQEVVDFVSAKLDQKTERLSQICEELFDYCLAPDTLGDGTGCDNMTCVIVHFNTLASATAKRPADDDSDKVEAQPSKKIKMEEETQPQPAS